MKTWALGFKEEESEGDPVDHPHQEGSCSEAGSILHRTIHVLSLSLSTHTPLSG